MKYIRENRPWWMVMFVGVFGCGPCCSGCGCAGRDHPVFTAAEKGEVEKVREALDADPTLLTETYRRPPRGRDPFSSNTGKQLVHIAAENGKVEVLKLLKERDADLNAEANGAWQPIHFAAQKNHANTVAWLLDHGVSVDAKMKHRDETPLHTAAGSDSVETVELLLARGAAVDARCGGNTATWTALIAACKNSSDKSVEIAKRLLDKGADVNARESDSQMSPLHHAAKNGTLTMVELLLAHKADVRAKNKDGETPIELNWIERADVAELLIANGASRELWEKRKRDAAKPGEPPPPKD